MERIAVVFKNEEIRRTLHNNEWWFSVDDIVEALTNSSNCTDYIKEFCKHDQELSRDWGEIVIPLWIGDPGGKQKVNCASIEGIFRIIQSIPSPKAEPYKRWLAKVGSDRVQEILHPELATKRTKAIYRANGYSEAWIEKRMRGIAVQAEPTDEWQNRGVNGEPEYAILTAEISKAAFGLTPSEYKELKGLERENLRDHMTDLELIFSMLGEAATTEIARRQDAQGFGENKTAARKGGRIAGEARGKLENETGSKVVSSENYLTEPESRMRLKDTKK
ncbi:MAG: phage antirepressor protein [Desulfurivibrio sp.]|nr:MAG: phage antirepressor protein [Desulfurivibrio sp.]